MEGVVFMKKFSKKHLLIILCILLLGGLFLSFKFFWSQNTKGTQSKKESSFSSSKNTNIKGSSEISESDYISRGLSKASEESISSLSSLSSDAILTKSTLPASEGSAIPEGQQQYNRKIPESKPGQLTAGEWDDLHNLSFWAELIKKDAYRDYLKHWDFNINESRTIIVKCGDSPVVDAKVIIKELSDKVIWQARTNYNGEVVFFPKLFNKQSSNKYLITVNTTTENKDLSDVELSSNHPLIINMNANQDSKIVDIMLVVDTTGSMSDELEYLKTELKNVIKNVKDLNQNNINIRVSCNFYRDHGDEYVVKPFNFSGNIDEVLSQINNQRADGGGDFEEAVEEALENAVMQHDWSQDAKARLLFLVLDAPPHYDQAKVEKLKKVVQAASEKGIRIIPIASSGIDKDTEFLLRFMDMATGGTYVFLTDHSGIGRSHLEASVGLYNVEYLNELLVKIINRHLGKP